MNRLRWFFLFSFFLLGGVFSAWAQTCTPDPLQLGRHYRLPQDDFTGDMVPTSDGGWLIAGATTSIGAGSLDGMAMRLDSCMNVLWVRSYGDSLYDQTGSVLANDSGYLLAGGTSLGPAPVNTDPYFVQIDGNGDVLWSKVLDVANPGHIEQLIGLSNGDIMALAFHAIGTGVSPLLLRLDDQANVIWSRALGGTFNDLGIQMIQASNSDMILAGTRFNYPGITRQAYVSRVDTAGNVQWSRSYDSGFDDDLYTLAELPNGDIMVGGTTRSTTVADPNMLLCKLNAQGDLLWSKDLVDTGLQACHQLIYRPNGTVVALVRSDTTNLGDGSVRVVELDTAGNVLSTRSVGTLTGHTYFSGFFNPAWSLANDGGIWFAMESFNFSLVSNDRDVWLVKLDSNLDQGCFIIPDAWASNPLPMTTTVLADTLQPPALPLATHVTLVDSGSMIDTVLCYTPQPCDPSSYTQFQRVMGGTSDDSGAGLIQTSDGGWLLTGSTTSFGTGSRSGLAIKLDGCLNEEWSFAYGSNDQDYFSTVIEDSLGYLFGGTTRGWGAVLRDWFMVRTDFNGVVQWTQRRGGAGNEALRFLRQFPNGDFLQAGFVSAVGAGSIEGCLSRIDPMGNLVWMKAYGDTAEDWPRDVIFAANGDIVVAGVREDYLAAPTAFLMRTDSAGNVLWTRDINGSGTEFGQGVIEMPNGDLVMVGATNTAGAGQFDVLLIRTDAQGNLIWSKSFGGAQQDFGWSIALAADGNILISGWTRSIGVGDQDIFISKVDPSGNLLWTSTYGGPAVEGEFLTHEKSLIATPDGGGIRLASTASFGPGNLDLLLLKVDSMGLAECEVATNGFQPDTVLLASTLIPQVETVINPNLGTDMATSTPVTFADSNFCEGPVVPPIVCTADASFSSLIGDSNSHEIRQVIATPDGGHLSVGFRGEPQFGASDVLAIKTNAGGTVQWSRSYGTFGEDRVNAVTQTSDGGYVLAGHNDLFGQLGGNAAFYRIDANGNPVWYQVMIGQGFEEIWSVEACADGGFIACGTSFGTGGFDEDVYLVKLDSNGQVDWTRIWRGIGTDSGAVVTELPNGNLLVCGSSDAFGAGDFDVWALILDDTGGLVTNRTFGTAQDDYGMYAQRATDGGFLFAGMSQSANGDEDALLFKTDSLLNLEWEQVFEAPGDQRFSDVVELPNSRLVAFGISEDSTATNALVIKTDSVGELVWSQQYENVLPPPSTPFNGIRIRKGLALANDSGFVVSVSVIDSANVPSAWLFKPDCFGNLDCQSDIIALNAVPPGLQITTPTPLDTFGTVPGFPFAFDTTLSLAAVDPCNPVVNPQPIPCTDTTTWEKNSGDPSFSENAVEHLLLPDSGYIWTGSYRNVLAGHNFQALVGRSDANGQEIWTRLIGDTAENMFLTDFDLLPDGGLVACGQRANSTGTTEGYVIRLDANGSGVWASAAPLNPPAGMWSIHVGIDGNYHVLATEGPSLIMGTRDLVHIAYDSLGNMITNTQYEITGVQEAHGILQLPDSGFLMLGRNENDNLIIRTAADGTVVWVRNYGFPGTNPELPTHIEAAVGGGWLVSSNTILPGGIDEKAVFFRINDQGEVMWSHAFGTSAISEAINSFVQTPEGDIIAAGATQDTFSAPLDGWIFRMDSARQVQWSYTYGDSNTQALGPIVQTPEGGFLASGYTFSVGLFLQDAYWVNTDCDGLSCSNEVWPIIDSAVVLTVDTPQVTLLALPTYSTVPFLVDTHSIPDSFWCQPPCLLTADAGSVATCSGPAYQLGGNPTGPLGSTYQWSPSTFLDSIDIANPTATLPDSITSMTFAVTVTDTTGCSGTDTVRVTNSAFTLSRAPYDSLVCAGDSVNLEVVIAQANSSLSFSWQPTNLVTDSTGNPTFGQTTVNQNFQVLVTDSFGCSDTLIFPVLIDPDPQPTFSYEQFPACEAVNVRFQSEGNTGTLLWQFPSATSDSEQPEWTYGFDEVLPVSLSVTSLEGCVGTTSDTLSSIGLMEERVAPPPNVFTPNGDGLNDYFEYHPDFRIEDCTSVTIYNRWGQLVFKSAGGAYRWDGVGFDGQPVPAGVYFYTVEVGSQSFKGTVQVLK